MYREIGHENAALKILREAYCWLDSAMPFFSLSSHWCGNELRKGLLHRWQRRLDSSQSWYGGGIFRSVVGNETDSGTPTRLRDYSIGRFERPRAKAIADRPDNPNISLGP